jgi:predicted HTH transcriptional regulator
MESDVRLKLDRYDRAIVRALQLDGRMTNSQLAESVSLSESACLRRVRAWRKPDSSRAIPRSSINRRRGVR